MRILLVYLPFCTPAIAPYSITNLHAFLSNNLDEQIDVLDLNIEFHKLKFSKFQSYYQDIKNWDHKNAVKVSEHFSTHCIFRTPKEALHLRSKDREITPSLEGNYDQVTKEYDLLTKKTYAENNKNVVNGKKPELFNELLKKIKDQKPDIVVFSIVYSSQAFYAHSLLEELNDVVTIIGGPAVNDKLRGVADVCLNNEMELLNYIKEKEIEHSKINFNNVLDFSTYNLEDYFTPKTVIPIRTSTTCCYKRCTFCNHFNNSAYYEFPVEMIKKSIVNSKQKHFFFIDDMIPKKRLLELAKMLKPLNVKWTCQLKPTKDLDLGTLKTLHGSGLTMVIWGVESGSDRILDKMKKGTNANDVEKVLLNSHCAGIKNVTYIMFGFPTETEEEFLETVDFLKRNCEVIDLVSVSIFGLQKGTYVYNNSKEFSITKIIEEERTILEPKISYEVNEGLTPEEVRKLVKKHRKVIDSINKYPKTMNFFREHMFCLVGDTS